MTAKSLESQEPIRVGVLGLGRAFTLMLPTFLGERRVKLVAAYDPREQARDLFEKTFGGKAHSTAEDVCADPLVEWVYIATPHQLHAEHVELAARYGKSALVEKPMAISLEECSRMIEACEGAKTELIVGHSHSFNAPVLLARELIDSGEWGGVRLVHSMQYTDFLYRPRRPEELDTTRGGGVVFSQAAHQIDIVRLLAGGGTTQVRAVTGAWDKTRPTEGAFTALLNFANGAFASVTYSGYGFYDTDTLMGGIGELGGIKSRTAHLETRRRLTSSQDELREAELKAERNFGGRAFSMPELKAPEAFQHFGPVVVSCERGDLRLTPYGVEVFDAFGARLVKPLSAQVPRSEVIDELWSVAKEGSHAIHDGPWSRATLEVCLAILESSRRSMDIMLKHQVGYFPPKTRHGRP